MSGFEEFGNIIATLSCRVAALERTLLAEVEMMAEDDAIRIMRRYREEIDRAEAGMEAARTKAREGRT